MCINICRNINLMLLNASKKINHLYFNFNLRFLELIKWLITSSLNDGNSCVVFLLQERTAKLFNLF